MSVPTIFQTDNSPCPQFCFSFYPQQAERPMTNVLRPMTKLPICRSASSPVVFAYQILYPFQFNTLNGYDLNRWRKHMFICGFTFWRCYIFATSVFVVVDHSKVAFTCILYWIPILYTDTGNKLLPQFSIGVFTCILSCSCSDFASSGIQYCIMKWRNIQV